MWPNFFVPTRNQLKFHIFDRGTCHKKCSDHCWRESGTGQKFHLLATATAERVVGMASEVPTNSLRRLAQLWQPPVDMAIHGHRVHLLTHKESRKDKSKRRNGQNIQHWQCFIAIWEVCDPLKKNPCNDWQATDFHYLTDLLLFIKGQTNAQKLKLIKKHTQLF